MLDMGHRTADCDDRLSHHVQSTEKVFASILSADMPAEQAADAAGALAKRFHSVNEALLATPRQISEANDLGAMVADSLAKFRDIQLDMIRLLLHREEWTHMDYAVRTYAMFTLSVHENCTAKVFLLRNDRLFDEVDTIHGSVDKIVISAREIMKRAVLNNCNGVGIVFGRKFGGPEPTMCERVATANLEKACAALDISFKACGAVVSR